MFASQVGSAATASRRQKRRSTATPATPLLSGALDPADASDAAASAGDGEAHSAGGKLVRFEGEGTTRATADGRSSEDRSEAVVAASDPPIPTAMVEGMRKLVAMHNSDELRFLAQNFDVPDSLTHEERLRTMHEVVLVTEVAYRRVLRAAWEGIVIEYWRSEGKVLKHHKFDLKHIVWTWWLRERTEAAKPPAKWVPVYTPVELRPQRPVEEGVTSDPRMERFVGSVKEAELDVKRTEWALRHTHDREHLMDYFSADARLRGVERRGRGTLLEELQGARAQLEEANRKNHELFKRIEDTRAATARSDAERRKYKQMVADKRQELADARAACAQLKHDLGVDLKSARRDNKQLRQSLTDTKAEIVRHDTELLPQEAKNHKKLSRKHEKVAAVLAEHDAEIASWAHERDRTRAKLAHMIATSVHEDELLSVYFANNALLAAEQAELMFKLDERTKELRNMALMVHAESETRYAMVANPKAFQRVKRRGKKGKKGKRGRSPSKKKKGASKGGKGKSKSKSPSKRKK